MAGDGNVVETHPARPEPSHEDQAPGTSQRNTAKDHGTVYAVTQGDMHIYQHDDSEKPES